MRVIIAGGGIGGMATMRQCSGPGRPAWFHQESTREWAHHHTPHNINNPTR